MQTQSRSLLLVLLVVVASAFEASATTYAMPFHEWTVQSGGSKFGFSGYAYPAWSREYKTVVHYGFGEFRTQWPVHVVAALSGTLPLLVMAVYMFFVRRRSEKDA